MPTDGLRAPLGVVRCEALSNMRVSSGGAVGGGSDGVRPNRGRG